MISAAATLLQYYWDANPLRLTGYGALYNPLLSAHVYGAFTAFWLAYWMQSRPILAPLPLISWRCSVAFSSRPVRVLPW